MADRAKRDFLTRGSHVASQKIGNKLICTQLVETDVLSIKKLQAHYFSKTNSIMFAPCFLVI